ncbi:hypothetical protein GOBAR_DD29749 [Gossypium barbadense]|nr:hypothetical protein GOBAR_DD29749 [Gossypium barbadense]
MDFMIEYVATKWYQAPELLLNCSGLLPINEEPTCPSPFIVNFEQTKSNKDNIKELVWKESWKFNQDMMVE